MKVINYPFVYEALYRQPLLIEAGVFHAIHAVVFPRIVSAQPMTMDIEAATSRQKEKTGVNPFNGRRPTKAGPAVEGSFWSGYKVVDDRFYFTIEGKEDTALVPVYGMLVKNASYFEQACYGMSDVNPINTAIVQAMKSKDVSKIVLDLASPGGQVTGIRELARNIRAASQEYGKTVYAFTDERCCSAAYWLASQANEIYTTPSATIGSIGTYLAWLDETVKMQLEGVRLEYFGAGEHKGMGLPGKPLTQKDRQLLQDRVNEINGWFTGSVKAARSRISNETMQGQVFSGDQAVLNHLSDGLVNDWEEFLDLL